MQGENAGRRAPIDFVIRDFFENMDFSRAAEMLARSFRTPGVSRDELVQGARYSALVVGAFHFSHSTPSSAFAAV